MDQSVCAELNDIEANFIIQWMVMDSSNYVILLDKRHSMSVDVDYNSTGALTKMYRSTRFPGVSYNFKSHKLSVTFETNCSLQRSSGPVVELFVLEEPNIPSQI